MLLRTVIIIFLAQFSDGFKCSLCIQQPLYTIHTNCPLCKDRLNETTCFLEVPDCDPSYPYRSYNGSCNNLQYPLMGKKLTVYSRILLPDYEDGKYTLRTAKNGQMLPLSRLLRTTLFRDVNITDNEITSSAMVWGHAISHDLGFNKGFNITTNCCAEENMHNQHVCLPLIIPANDPFYSKFNLTCISKHRSRVTLIGDCNEDQPVQQFNTVTHALDVSQVYGSDAGNATMIRSFQGGQLMNQTSENGGMFPPNLPPDQAANKCRLMNPHQACYNTGDPRVNQIPDIALFQTIMLREHNRLAKAFQDLEPDWDDETLYQKARAIVIAEFQHITYKDWLPIFLGKSIMKKHYLTPKSNGFIEFNGTVNIAVLNSIISAALHFGHTTIPGYYVLFNHLRKVEKVLAISPWQLKPYLIQEGGNFDQMLLGFTIQRMQASDTFYTRQVTDLLDSQDYPYMSDLVASDILRGRDHGLAVYVNYLELCTGHKVRSFAGLSRYIPKKYIYDLKKLYNTVEDIDLMVGGNLEEKVPGARLGPTFLCLWTEEFYRKKWGDRFWYEVGGQPGSFTEGQLQEIRKSSLSRLICDNSDNITEIAPNSFLKVSKWNKLTKCENIPSIDLSKW